MFKNQQKLSEYWSELIDLAEKYEAKDSLLSHQASVDNFVMKMPLVGLFSAGKSSLLNKVIKDKLLSVEITPETAIATELYYTDDSEAFYGYDSNGHRTALSRADINSQSFVPSITKNQSSAYEVISAHINAPVLAQFPHVCLVDLPGLESNFSSHQQMIDTYIAQSLAYCIVVSIEDGELKASTQQFLQELKFNSMPVILIISKSDVKTDDDAQAVAQKIQESVTTLLGCAPLRTVLVSARKKRNLDAVIEAFVTVETLAEQRFDSVVTRPLITELTFLSQNLDKLMSMDDVSAEQLKADKQQLENDIASFRKKLNHDTELLESKVQGVVSHIIDKVKSQLAEQLDMLAGSLLQNRDISVSIENIVRLSVSEGIESDLIPVLNKHIKHIEAELPDSLQIQAAEINLDAIEDEDFSFTNLAMVLSPVLALLKFHPVITLISTIVIPTLAKVLDIVMSEGAKEARREQRQEAARQAIINEVIPKVVFDVKKSLTHMVINNINDAKDMMSKIVAEREQQIQAQITQTEKDIKASHEEQQKRKAQYLQDKRFITKIINELQ